MQCCACYVPDSFEASVPVANSQCFLASQQQHEYRAHIKLNDAGARYTTSASYLSPVQVVCAQSAASLRDLSLETHFLRARSNGARN